MSNWSAGKRLSVTTTLVVGLAVVLGISAAWVTSHLGNQLDRAINQMARQQMLAGQVSTRVSEIDALERGVAMAMMLQQTATVEELRQKLSTKEQEARKALEELRGLNGATVSADLQQMTSEFDAAIELHQQVVRALNDQKMDVAIATLNTQLLPRLTQLSDRGRHLVDDQARQLSLVGREAETARSVSFLSMLTLGLLSVLVGLAAVFSVHKIQVVLRQTVSELNENARRLANTAGRVSASSQSVSHAASEQAASLEETSASTEENHSMTKRNAENAESATRKTNEAADTIKEANLALSQMVVSMNEITTSSNKISKIIKVIDDIAFQTNILALNAAVEAARAGEAGMGFAVVADEVRNLAQRSAQAARDTTQLIEESIIRASEGKDKLDEVARAITVLTDSSLQAKALVEEVYAGSQEQSRGIAQISRTVLQMEQLTQQLAATAEEGAAAGQGLASQALRVDEIVVGLQKLVGVTDADPASDIQTFRPAAAASNHTHTPSLNALSQATQHKSRTTNSGYTDHFTKPSALQPTGGGHNNPDSILPLDDNDFKPF